MLHQRIRAFFASALAAMHPRRREPNRWLIAAAGWLMLAALGSVYASSVFLRAIMERYAVSQRDAGLAFTIAILAVGLTAGFGGTLQRRFGPRAVGTAGSLLYGAGVCLAGVAPNLPLYYLSQGVIGGIGIGLGYIVPLAMLIDWFPDKRGLVTGFALTGFGAGAAFASPIATALLNTAGLGTTLGMLGAAYLVIGVGAAQFFRRAPAGYAPSGWNAPVSPRSAAARRHWSLPEALRSPRWYLLWSILALNVTAGAAVISVAAPLAQDFSGVTAATAAFLVVTISIFNAAGRIAWGWASDRIGRPATFIGLFGLQFIAFCLLSRVTDFAALLALAALIGLCFGGGFAVMPAFTAEFFGAKHAGAIYGAMLTAWGAGATAGPLLIASMGYRSAANIIAAAMLAGVPLALSTRTEVVAAIARRLAALLPARMAPVAAGED